MAKFDFVEIFETRTRHPRRPRASDIIDRLFPDFVAYERRGVTLLAGTSRLMNKNLFIIA